MSGLKIYRASAGSGKTFSLAREYIRLLIEFPDNYKNILAVTFTNKATEEMKTRIIREIHKLASGEPSGYFDDLSSYFAISEEKIRNRAELILQKLLHDYSRFSVTTIDSFFQIVIRSFTRETGLQPGYNVELDNEKVLIRVVDNLMADIGDNDSLRNWLVRFMEQKISEGKSWNLKRDIYSLGDEVFKEIFKSFGKELISKMSDKEFLKQYQADLHKIINHFENTLKDAGTKAMKLMEDNGLQTDDFSYRSAGVAGYLYKLSRGQSFEPGSRPRSACGNTESWYSKQADKEIKQKIENICAGGLMDLLVSAVDFYDDNYIMYNSAIAVINNIFTLGILTDIANKVPEYADEENVFLLSDAVKVLHDIIADNEAPFIYEKTGYRYKYFMIDEFQDTSGMQWSNFKPLIGNSLAEGNSNLVVGDVKQAIYRWRNSDWKILSEQIENDFERYNIETENLDSNYRSKKNIVDFNNRFFTHAAEALQEQFNNELKDNENTGVTLSGYENTITKAYEDVMQKLPQGREGGYVRHEFIERGSEIPWQETVKENIPHIIEDLQDRGYLLRDIAILVRRKTEGKEIADIMLAYKTGGDAKQGYKYDVVSDESLYLISSPVIRLLIYILRYLNDPGNLINSAGIINEYVRYVMNNGNGDDNEQSLHRLFNITGEEDILNQLPQEFRDNLDSIMKMSLYEMTAELINVFSLNTIEEGVPYLLAFQDIILDYTRQNAPDLGSFLQWWDEQGYKKTIRFSEKQDAIRIMTIHKAKGLQFRVVIVPFCNWKLDHETSHSNILWCKPSVTPFNKLSLIPVRYTSSLAKTVFYSDYYTEKLHAYVDNLNLLYVAFTRSEEVLMTFAPAPDKKKRSSHSSVSGLLDHVITDKMPEHSPDNNIYEKGSLPPAVGKRDMQDDRDSSSTDIKLCEYYQASAGNRLKLRFRDRDYFEHGALVKADRISYGKFMHELFQNIIYEDDADREINNFIFEGKLNKEEGEKLREKVRELFKDRQIRNWFSHNWQVRTEPTILLKEGKTKRPDRVIVRDNKAVVIDYKWTEQEDEKYIGQVKEYMGLIKDMGYEDVEGYLLYMGKKNKVISLRQ